MFSVFAKAEERKALEKAWADWPDREKWVAIYDEGELPEPGRLTLVAWEGRLEPRPDWTLYDAPLLLWQPAFTPEEVRAICTPPEEASEMPAVFLKAVWNHLTHGAPLPKDMLQRARAEAERTDDPWLRHALMHNLLTAMMFGKEIDPDWAESEAPQWDPHVEATQLPLHTSRFFDLVTFEWLRQHGDTETALHILEESLMPIAAQLPPEGQLMIGVRYLEMYWPEIINHPDQSMRQAFKDQLWQMVETLEHQPRLQVQRALLLEIASIFALVEKSFSEALGYIKNALAIAESLHIADLIQRLSARKGKILLAWAKTGGQPQFYDQALKVFQQLARTIDPESQPVLYADTQEQIGTIFALKPVDEKKRGIMAGMAEAAFQEALQVVRQLGLEQEYARICNNYGNVLQEFPESRFTDKYEKAMFYYQEAIDRRPPDQYPDERARLQANYIHAALSARNQDDALLDNIAQRADEIIELTDDPELAALARNVRQWLGADKGP